MGKEKTKVFSVEQPKIEHHKAIDIFDDCESAHTCNIVGYYVERIAYLENLVKKYKFDHLTDLMMKADFEDKFDRVFEEYQFANMPFNIAIIDINGLHNTNRLKGYHVGDQLIRKCAAQLQDKFDFHQIFRISGDEFVVIVRESTLKKDEFENRLNSLTDVTFIIDSSVDYTSPKHMFKAMDKQLSSKKTDCKKREERL